MVAETLVKTGKLATVFGGSGFIGRYVAKALAEHGWRVRIASRRPNLAFALQPSGKVGQINAVQANLRYPQSIARAVRDADAVVNLVGLLAESGKQSFAALHDVGARSIAEAARDAGITNFVQISAIGADAQSKSVYARTKAAGEAQVRAIHPEAVIMRPSVVFGPEDQFFNRFAAMARIVPALPLIGGGHTKLQPVFVGDVAEAVARAIVGQAKAGATYELGGPDVCSLADVMRFVLETTGRRRALVPLPFPAAEVMASATALATRVSLGLMPAMLQMTPDQVELLRYDNVVSTIAQAEGRTLDGLGITPESFESFVPRYLVRFRRTGQYASYTAR